jgi:hypothetical protein
LANFVAAEIVTRSRVEQRAQVHINAVPMKDATCRRNFASQKKEAASFATAGLNFVAKPPNVATQGQIDVFAFENSNVTKVMLVKSVDETSYVMRGAASSA